MNLNSWIAIVACGVTDTHIAETALYRLHIDFITESMADCKLRE
ncbi:hypothetical protein [Ruminococcus sp.]|nr:hypothetical protein [Ruminococcus sp.]